MRDECLRFMRVAIAAAITAALLINVSAQSPSGLQVADVYRLRSVGDVQLSPDGTHVAYTISNHERPGRPYSQAIHGGPHSQQGAVFNAEAAAMADS